MLYAPAVWRPAFLEANNMVDNEQEVFMNWRNSLTRRTFMLLIAATLAGCATTGDQAQTVNLSGSQEVPPVNTSGTGVGTIRVGSDGSVTANIKTTNVNGVAAHIHEGAAGANGPVIVPLVKRGDNEWVSEPGAKFTPSQFEAYKAGRTYFNVHTPQNKGGEVRGQIRGTSGGSRAY